MKKYNILGLASGCFSVIVVSSLILIPPIFTHAATNKAEYAKIALEKRGVQTDVDSLVESIRAGQVGTVKLLLDAGIDPNSTFDGASMLHFAARYGNDAIVALLIQYGAEINATDDMRAGATPLLLAVQNSHAAIVKRLIKQKANVNLSLRDEDSENFAPIHAAIGQGDYEITKILVSAGANVNAKSKQFGTPLMLAATLGYSKLVNLLLSSGADVNLTDRNGATALHYACFNGHIDIAKKLINKGADINKRTYDNETPLFLASFNGHANVVKLLLSAGADVNIKSKHGLTALDAAMLKQHIEIAYLLQSKGAIPTAPIRE